jgi:hypothetical protein
MKTTFLSIVMLASLCFPATGAEVQPRRNLENLRTAIFQASKPRVSPKSTCTVTNDCSGTQISCQSTSGNCHSGSNWVECDEQRTYCGESEGCTAFLQCPTTGTVSCSGSTPTSCSLSSGQCSVICNGVETRCPNCNDY